MLDTLEPSDKPGYDPKDDLEVLEALWLDKLQPYGRCGLQRAGKEGLALHFKGHEGKKGA